MSILETAIDGAFSSQGYEGAAMGAFQNMILGCELLLTEAFVGPHMDAAGTQKETPTQTANRLYGQSGSVNPLQCNPTKAVYKQSTIINMESYLAAQEAALSTSNKNRAIIQSEITLWGNVLSEDQSIKGESSTPLSTAANVQSQSLSGLSNQAQTNAGMAEDGASYEGRISTCLV